MSASGKDGFTEASENHLRDALRVTHAERWRWLKEAMEFGFRSARERGRRGLVTLGPHGEVLWSAAHERAFSRGEPLPSSPAASGCERLS